MKLSELQLQKVARISAVCGKDASLEAKLREIGFAEDDEVEIMHRAPLTGSPLCIRLNETLVALRKNEAAAIEVEPAS